MERRQKLYMPVSSVTSTAKCNTALLSYLRRYQPSNMLNELSSRVWNCAHPNIIAEQLTQITSSKYMYIAQSLHATIKSLLLDPTDIAKKLALECCKQYETQLCALAIDDAGPKTKPNEKLMESILLECGITNETRNMEANELSPNNCKYDERTFEESNSTPVHTIDASDVDNRKHRPSNELTNSPIFDRLGIKRRASANKASGEPASKHSRLRVSSPIAKSTSKWRTIENHGRKVVNSSQVGESIIPTVTSTTCNGLQIKRSRLQLPTSISKTTLNCRKNEHQDSDSGNQSTGNKSTISTATSTSILEPENKSSRLRIPSPTSKSTLQWRNVEHLGCDSGNGSTSQESTISAVSSTTSQESQNSNSFIIRHARNYGPLRQLNSVYNRPSERRKNLLSEQNSNSIMKCSPRSSAMTALETLRLRSLRNDKKDVSRFQ